jgi:hypothetical protein
MRHRSENVDGVRPQDRDEVLKRARAALHRFARRERESKLEKDAVDYAVTFDCVHYKLNGAGRRGKVDHLFALPNGWDWYVEFKRDGEEPRTLQRLDHKNLRRRHHIVDVIDALPKFKNKLHALLAKHTGGSALL